LTAYIKWRPPEQRPGPDALPGDQSPCQAPTPRPPPSRITPTASSSASPASFRSAAVGRRRGGGGGGGGSRSQCDEDQVSSAQATVLQPAQGHAGGLRGWRPPSARAISGIMITEHAMS